MALIFNSDIVAGVLMAAPPQSSGGTANRFAAPLPVKPAMGTFKIDEAGTHGVELAGGPSGLPGRASGEPASRDTGKIKAFVEFESLLVRTMLESVLPGEEAQIFGSGFAGSMWRSMAAEQYASLFVSAGGLGLAENLTAGFREPEVPGWRPVLEPPIGTIRG